MTPQFLESGALSPRVVMILVGQLGTFLVTYKSYGMASYRTSFHGTRSHGRDTTYGCTLRFS